MAGKRLLGIGKASKSKKQKNAVIPSGDEKSASETPEASNELTVELNEEADAYDEIAQLRALWKTYADSDKDNELVINGIIHECDRLLRNAKQKEDSEKVDELPDDFHSIYALALAELAKFHSDDNKQVSEYFDAALERVDLGLDQHKDSIQLLFSKSKILLNKIPLQFISQLNLTSSIEKDDEETKKNNRFPELSTLLDEALESYEKAEKSADDSQKYELFNNDHLEILETLDDLLDIVDNFGKDLAEGVDDDEDEDEDSNIDLPSNHPLYSIRESDKYNQWWRDHIIKFLENVDKHSKSVNVNHESKENDSKSDDKENPLLPLRREICKRIGQSYLQEAEVPSTVFTTLAYDDDYEGFTEWQGLTREESQKIAQDLIGTALKYLKWAEDKEEPETWVNVAEAMISLGNLYDVDSEEQEKYYKEAEKILVKANNVTNGKYEDVLENLLEN
ncbi:enhancer of translation termination 1 [Scheffersomyces xylosifermentans]|uniref:enhancer of translation termination 1 n=1 Tax=Scheffersomyces xylosifermentans TaxID=1304137 RepID=UPI00315D7DD5